MKHAPYTHEHPTRTLSLRTRTRLFGTVNVAVALGGRSCGWGSCDHPRRWFVGHHALNRNGGAHFAEVVIRRDGEDRVLARVGSTAHRGAVA